MLNFDKLKSFSDEQKANRSVGGSFLRITEDESVRVRFIGGPNEPYQISTHWLNKQRTSTVCGGDQCVYCHYRQQDPSIGRAVPRLLFSVISDRRMKQTKEVMSNGEQRIRWNPTNAGDPEARREGRKYLEASWRTGESLAAEDKKLSRRGTKETDGVAAEIGLVKAISHNCTECGDSLNVPEDCRSVVCPECGHEGPPEEVLGMLNDEAPTAGLKRRNVQDCWVTISRSGTGTSTRYSFDPEPPSAMSEDDSKIEPFDFFKVKKAESTDDQAARLGYANPFGPGGDHVQTDASSESLFD